MAVPVAICCTATKIVPLLATMTNAAKKREMRRAANQAKGKPTRRFVWKSTNRYGGAPPAKAKCPKTKQQLQQQHADDQAQIRELQSQIRELSAQLVVARLPLVRVAQPPQALEPLSSAARRDATCWYCSSVRAAAPTLPAVCWGSCT